MNKINNSLLTTHTNKITSDGDLVNTINDIAPPNIEYANIKHKIFHIVYKLDSIPICDHPKCNNPVKWDKGNQKYTKYCSYQCSNQITAISSSDKRINTNQQKYGGNAPACNTKIIKKAKITNIERYGNNYTKVNNEKSKQAIKQKYGVINQSQRHITKEAQARLKNKHYMYTEHIKKQQPLQKIATDLGVSDTTVGRFLKDHNIQIQRFYKSGGELEIRELLDSLNVEYETNTKQVIPPQELDIYIPQFKIAIEYNGVYWHSEIAGKNANYHLNKTKLCEEQGIRLIHIFEDEWKFQKQQCIDTIKHFLNKSEKGVYARQTYIKEINWRIAKKFLNEYHLLGAGSCGNYRIGAYDKNDNLIGVMVFGKQNNENSEDVIELRRFVTNKKNNPGLGSKMFKYAIKQTGYERVIAFVDRRWFTGLVKDHIGFVPIHCTKPAIWWTDGKNRYHRRHFTKKQLINNVDNSTNTSKRKLLANLGFYRIWDCGKIKLEWKSE